MSKSSRVRQVLSNKGDAIDETETELGSPLAASTEQPPEADLTMRVDRIRLAAYAAAERRGFQPGHEETDWLEAEREVDAQAGQADAPPTP